MIKEDMDQLRLLERLRILLGDVFGAASKGLFSMALKRGGRQPRIAT